MTRIYFFSLFSLQKQLFQGTTSDKIQDPSYDWLKEMEDERALLRLEHVVYVFNTVLRQSFTI